MTAIQIIICLAVMALLLFISCILLYIAPKQRKKLTRNNFKLTVKEAQKDKRVYPWIYCPSLILSIPLFVGSLFLGDYTEIIFAIGVVIAFVTYHLLIFGMWKVHDMLIFEKPKEPTIRLQTSRYQLKKVFCLHNIFAKRHRQLFFVIYQVIDENGQIYFVKGELDNPFHMAKYDIVVSIGQQTGRLYFEKIKKVYPPVNN